MKTNQIRIDQEATDDLLLGVIGGIIDFTHLHLGERRDSLLVDITKSVIEPLSPAEFSTSLDFNSIDGQSIASLSVLTADSIAIRVIDVEIQSSAWDTVNIGVGHSLVLLPVTTVAVVCISILVLFVSVKAPIRFCGPVIECDCELQMCLVVGTIATGCRC